MKAARWLIDLALVCLILYILCVPPSHAQRRFADYLPVVVDCTTPLKPWQIRVELVRIDGLTLRHCKEPR